MRSSTMTGLGTLLALAGACGSSSNSEVTPDGGAAGTTGAAGSAGAAGTTGTAGATGTAGSGGGCAPRTTFAEASHTIVNVTWRAATAAMAGDGQVHLWGKTVLTASGNTLSGTLQACGSVLPATTLNALGGGGMILIEIPAAAWDAPSMPRFQLAATQTGWNVGSTLSYGYAALIGFGVATWPTPPPRPGRRPTRASR